MSEQNKVMVRHIFKQITMTGIDIFRVANGKIIEGWTYKENIS